VWRAGQHLDLSVALAPARQLVPVTSWDTKPTYFAWAGMVGAALGQWLLCRLRGCQACWGLMMSCMDVAHTGV
jgi:hypothetical protein